MADKRAHSQSTKAKHDLVVNSRLEAGQEYEQQDRYEAHNQHRQQAEQVLYADGSVSKKTFRSWQRKMLTVNHLVFLPIGR